MSTIELSGLTLEVDADGNLTSQDAWNEEVAAAFAKDEGIEELTERHWIVINFIRDWYKNNNEIPTIRTMKSDSGVDVKELYKLFPKGPIKKASRISGLPKPKSCI